MLNSLQTGSIYNLHQKTVPLLQSIFTSLFHRYLFTKSSLQTPLTLSFSIPRQFFTSFFCVQPSQNLHQQYFPTSILLPIQAELKHQGPREPCEDWHNFNLSLLPQSMDSNNRVKNHWFFIVKILKSCVLQVQQTIQSTFSHSLNLLSLLPYPNNTTARTNVLLQTSCLTWFSS